MTTPIKIEFKEGQGVDGAVARLSEFWAAYHFLKPTRGSDNVDRLITSALSTLGNAIDDEKYHGPEGYTLFKKDLLARLKAD